jgi:hypothetical protein
MLSCMILVTCHCANLPLNQCTSYFFEKSGPMLNLFIGAITGSIELFYYSVTHVFVRDFSDMS